MSSRRVACWEALASIAFSLSCGETLPAATSGDAGPASSDATTDAASDGGGGCKTAPFLDDFGRATADVAAGWSSTFLNNGTASIELGAFRSETTAGEKYAPRYAVLVKDLDAVPKTLECRFRLRVDTPINDDYVDAISFALANPDGTRSLVRFSVQHSSITVREDVHDANGNCVLCPKGIALTTSSVVDVATTPTVTFSTNFKEATGRIEGGPSVGGAIAGFVPTKVSIWLGAANFATEAATHVYDDLVCQLGCP